MERILLSVLTLLALTACSDGVVSSDPKAKPGAVRVHRAPSGEMDVWRDPQTGCEYFSYTSSGGLTPRLMSDGKPLCRP